MIHHETTDDGPQLAYSSVSVDARNRRTAYSLLLMEHALATRTREEATIMQTPERSGILVVEDDPATSEYLLTLLNIYDYQAEVAPNGRAALAYLTQHSVDAILLDWRLPDMDGPAISRYIRAHLDANVPIIMLTADHAPSLVETAHAAGVDDVLQKPFQPNVLLEHLHTLLEERWNN
jgi:CheY-like chemotaxis protein